MPSSVSIFSDFAYSRQKRTLGAERLPSTAHLDLPEVGEGAEDADDSGSYFAASPQFVVRGCQRRPLTPSLHLHLVMCDEGSLPAKEQTRQQRRDSRCTCCELLPPTPVAACNLLLAARPHLCCKHLTFSEGQEQAPSPCGVSCCAWAAHVQCYSMAGSSPKSGP